jgi:hypothetical protein
VADQRSLAELNYVHISVNAVHLSRSASTKGDGARRQGRIAPAGHASSADYRYRQEIALAVVTPPSTTRTAAAQSSPYQRVVAEVLADFTDRAAAGSAQRPAWTSVTELGLRRSIGPLGRA